jgi:arsenite methyltransferase
MTGWADWLVAQGEADAASVADVERVLEAAALRPGDTVLDVGAGLGLLTLAAHERIGDGWVIAVDPSVGALEDLLRLAHAANASGIMYLVGDAEVLPLPDASVDVAVLGAALSEVADPGAAVRELARVLRSGGRLSLREPLPGDGAGRSAAVDWSPLGELGARADALVAEHESARPAPRIDARALEAELERAGFAELAATVERTASLPGADAVDAYLDAGGNEDGDGTSLRARWQAAFTRSELESLVSHLRGAAEATALSGPPQLFLSARRS